MLNVLANLVLTATLALVGGGATQEALHDARSLGYQPCEPTLVDASSGWTALGFGQMPDNVAAWAAWPEAFGVCAVGWTPETLMSEDAEWVDYVARHEVCHLAVGVQIDANPDNWALADRHHEAEDFKVCMERMLHVDDEVPAIEYEDTDPPCHTDAECANWEYSPEDGWVSLVDNGEGSLPECPDAYNGYCADPGAVVHDTRTGASATVADLYPANPPTDAEHCAMLHEVKPWIPCN